VWQVHPAAMPLSSTCLNNATSSWFESAGFADLVGFYAQMILFYARLPRRSLYLRKIAGMV
jgi:hypothetical protein